MNCSKLEVSQLIAELKAHAEHLQFVTAFAARKQLAKFFAHEIAELQDVKAFIAYLVETTANVAQTATNRTRCSFHKEIRRCFAIAKDCGLNTADESGMRAAFSRCLGRTLASRADLNSGDWDYVGHQVKCGALSW